MSKTITKVTAACLKGRTFAYGLSPVTLLWGRNEAGKTAVLDAVALALLGRAPGVASKPSDVHARLASGPSLAVATEGAEGLAASRSWTLSGKSVKYRGPDAEFPAPVMLDPQEFFGLSGPAQTRYLFSKAALPESMTRGRLLDTIRANVKNIRVEANTEATEKAGRSLLEAIEGVDQFDAVAVQDWLAAVVAKVTELKNAAVASVQRMEKSAQASAQVGQAEPADQRAEARLEEARAALEAAQAQLVRLAEQGRAAAAARDEAEGKAESAVDESVARARMAELSKEKERLAKLTAKEPPALVKLQTEVQLAAAAESDALTGLALDTRQLEETKKGIADTEKMGACPTCKQELSNKGLIVKQLKARLKDVEASAEDHAEKYKAAKERAVKARDWLKAANDAWADFNDAQAAFRRASQEHADLQAKLAANAAAAEAKAALPGLEAKVNQLAVLYTAKADEVTTLRGLAAEAEEGRKALLAERAEAAQRGRVAEEAARSRAEAAVLKEVAKMLAELQQRLVDESVGPLVAAANEVAGHVLRRPLAYQDGELGMEDGGRFWSWHSFSGTGKALAFAGLGVALAAGAPARIAVLDELGRLDDANKHRLVARLCELVEAGRLDQALLVDVRPLPAGAVKSKSFSQVEVL